MFRVFFSGGFGLPRARVLLDLEGVIHGFHSNDPLWTTSSVEF